MSVTKEVVLLEGLLKGEGHQRKCRVKAVRHATYEDECTTPNCLSYSRCEIEDSDDFPDGDYELEFDSHRVALTKKSGHYLLQCPDQSDSANLSHAD
jgi:hypothetical protein